VILIATVLSAGSTAALQHFLREPVYTATTQLFAVVPGDAGVFSAYYGGMGATARMETYRQLATSTIVAARTIDDVALDMTPAELAKKITAKPTPGDLSRYARPMSTLLRVQVTDSDPDTAVKAANALSKNLAALSRELEWTESKVDSPVQYTGPGAELVQVDSASSAVEVAAPLWKDAAYGAGMGCALSCIAVLILGVARGSVLSTAEVDHVAKQALSSTVPWSVR
jgi:capsular polysaccharide biosynthesis protein